MKTTNIAHIRNDIFLSFHGSEELYRNGDDDVFTIRELAKSLVESEILQQHGVNNKGRIGTLNIFFDDKNLTESSDADIKRNILNGLLQT